MTFVLKHDLQKFILVSIRNDPHLFLFLVISRKKVAFFTKWAMDKNHDLYALYVFLILKFLGLMMACFPKAFIMTFMAD